MTDRELQAVREELLSTIDDGYYELYAVQLLGPTQDEANEQRLDFVDELVNRLRKRLGGER
jgi:hypothetical protein